MAEIIEEAPVWNGPDASAVKQADLGPAVVAVITDRTAGPAPAIRIQYPAPEVSEWVFGWLRPDDRAAIRLAAAVRCPRMETAQLLSLFPPEALLCLDRQELHLGPAFLKRVAGVAAYEGEPAWLAQLPQYTLATARDGDVGAMPVHLAPESGVVAPADGWYRAVAHFSDPRSADCVRRPRRAPFLVESPAEQLLWCRQQLVVTTLTAVPPPAP